MWKQEWRIFFFFLSLHGGADLACKKEAKSFGTVECAVGQTGKEAGLRLLLHGRGWTGALSEKRKKDDLDNCWQALSSPWTQYIDKECFGDENKPHLSELN